MAEESIYNQIGGKPAVDAAVLIFYQKVLNDERINDFFFGVNMEDQRRKQKLFLTYVLGGAPNYPEQSLRKAHKRLVDDGLNDEHFDIVVTHLADTLKELGVSDNIIGQIAAVAESVRDDVLNR